MVIGCGRWAFKVKTAVVEVASKQLGAPARLPKRSGAALDQAPH